MDVMPPPSSVHPRKRQRLGDDPKRFDSIEGGRPLTNVPELDNIRSSGSQLQFLQAQLAATEALFAAYQDEFCAISKHLSNVKQLHLQKGEPLWKDAKAATEAMQRQQRLQSLGADSHVPETFSDIEEEVLLLSGDADTSRQAHGEASSAATTGATCQGANQRSDGVTDVCADPVAVGPTGIDSTGMANGSGGEPEAATRTADGGDATAGNELDSARQGRLEALEAACSAVAQEDMEAQGALACLAGRSGKYYLRSLLVTLGRCTDSKGDVDVDLGPEEEEADARCRLQGAAEAAGRGTAGATAGGSLPEQASGAAPPAAARASGVVEGEGDREAAAVANGDAGAVSGSHQTPAAGAPGSMTPAASRMPPSSPPPPPRNHVVSRRQALIRLDADGQFRLVNMGRATVWVNGTMVPQSQMVPLPHLSLLEVGGVRLLFLANLAAVARVARRSAALVL